MSNEIDIKLTNDHAIKDLVKAFGSIESNVKMLAVTFDKVVSSSGRASTGMKRSAKAASDELAIATRLLRKYEDEARNSAKGSAVWVSATNNVAVASRIVARELEKVGKGANSFEQVVYKTRLVRGSISDVASQIAGVNKELSDLMKSGGDTGRIRELSQVRDKLTEVLTAANRTEQSIQFKRQIVSGEAIGSVKSLKDKLAELRAELKRTQDEVSRGALSKKIAFMENSPLLGGSGTRQSIAQQSSIPPRSVRVGSRVYPLKMSVEENTAGMASSFVTVHAKSPGLGGNAGFGQVMMQQWKPETEREGLSMVKWSNSHRAVSGQNVGMRMYAEAMLQAMERGGTTFASDVSVSKSAQAVWKKLSHQLGVPLKTGANIQFEPTGEASVDDGPVYSLDLTRIDPEKLRRIRDNRTEELRQRQRYESPVVKQGFVAGSLDDLRSRASASEKAYRRLAMQGGSSREMRVGAYNQRERDRIRLTEAENKFELESGPPKGSMADIEQQRRKLLDERSRIAPGDAAAMQKNVKDLRDLEVQASKTTQEYKALQASIIASGQANTASGHEERIAALKTLQNSVASNTGEYKRLKEEVKQAEGDFARFRGEIVAVDGSVDKLSSEMKELENSIEKLEPNTPEWKRLNDELFTTKRRLNEVNDQTKRYQSMQGKGWFGRTFMTPLGGGGGAGGNGVGAGMGGFGGTVMGQVKTLAATYVGLYEGINMFVRELEHGREALRRHYETGIVADQEVVRQTATLGTDMIGPMKTWAQGMQGELMSSTENILRVAGFTKQMGITDIEGIKEMTGLALKASRGDADVAQGLQQIAVVLMKTQGSNNYKGALGQARQMAEASAGVNELIFNQNIADRLVTMSIASKMQQIKPLSAEQIAEFMGAGSRTFSDVSGDVISRAVLVGFDSLLDFKPRKSYKGTRVPDEVMEAYKNAGSLQERYDIVSQSNELGFQFAQEKADRQGPLADSIEKMFTSTEFRKNLGETQKLITSIDEAGTYFEEQVKATEENTIALGIVSQALMSMQQAQTTDKALLSGGAQKIMDRVGEIDLVGLDFKDRAIATLTERDVQLGMLNGGQPYNEALVKLANVQSLIATQREKGVQDDNPIMLELLAAEKGLAELADQLQKAMKPSEIELQKIYWELKRLNERSSKTGVFTEDSDIDRRIELEARQRELKSQEVRDALDNGFKAGAGINAPLGQGFGAARKGGPAGAAGGGLFSIPPEVLTKVKTAQVAGGFGTFGPSTLPITNGALREHMRTGKVGGPLFGGLGRNGSSQDAGAIAGQLRSVMGQIDPALMGSAMNQANAYNGFTAAMEDPLRLTPDDKLRIAKESAKRYMEGGAAADSTGLGKRFGKGSPIGPDSAFVQTGKAWWERDADAANRMNSVQPGNPDALRSRYEKDKARKLIEREERIEELKKQREQKAADKERLRDLESFSGEGLSRNQTDPEMKAILKNLATALAAFEAKSAGSTSESRRLNVPIPRQPFAVGVS